MKYAETPLRRDSERPRRRPPSRRRKLPRSRWLGILDLGPDVLPLHGNLLPAPRLPGRRKSPCPDRWVESPTGLKLRRDSTPFRTRSRTTLGVLARESFPRKPPESALGRAPTREAWARNSVLGKSVGSVG